MAIAGLIYTILLFLFCFCTVHIIKLAAAGFMSFRKKPEEPPPKEEKKSEPVYYIVERKRSRKAKYSEPKQIEFKDK